MNSLDMLNTKYIIYNDENKKNVYVKDDIPGSAWFVKENINVANDNDEILSLDSLNFKNKKLEPIIHFDHHTLNRLSRSSMKIKV